MGECFITRRGGASGNAIEIDSVPNTSGNVGAVCTIPISKIPVGHSLFISGAIYGSNYSGGYGAQFSGCINRKADGTFAARGYGAFCSAYNTNTISPTCTTSGDNLIVTMKYTGASATASDKSCFSGILVSF